jgi:hypothetical protein
MCHEFKNKIVLVTGGNSGIGKVIISGRDSIKGSSVTAEGLKNGWSIDFICTDASVPEESKT